MKPEYIVIHRALHTPHQHSVEVHGVHRIIKTRKNGNRYVLYRNGDEDHELIAINKRVTLVIPLLAGYRCTFGRITVTDQSK